MRTGSCATQRPILRGPNFDPVKTQKPQHQGKDDNLVLKVEIPACPLFEGTYSYQWTLKINLEKNPFSLDTRAPKLTLLVTLYTYTNKWLVTRN